ncbi:hypothetical protein GGI17_006132 [Coemansia sp. S146]|nr:hypothetical protein GGI17_006132 [Coemansia sp. S146]
MSAAVWLVTILLLAALAHVGGNGDQEVTGKTQKRNAWQQLRDGLCALVLRAAHLAFTIHRSFQAWVQNSLSQAELDVQELLQGDDTEELTEKRQHLADFLQSLPQRPEHFAVILPEANECSQGGSLKTSFDEIAYRLRKSSMTQRVTANGRMARICLDDGNHVEYSGGDDMDVDTDLCIERPLSLHVSLWSRDNGYPALARLARELAGQAECGRLPSDSIDESYVATKLVDAAGHQHPDLVLLYDDLVCIPDFPPWQLQNSEVFQIGSTTARSLGNAVLSAFASYANIEKRFGK